jgi:hypothetical protein
MTFLTTLLLGTGKLRPELRAALEAEGVVLIEEGLVGSVRYKHFKAPGKRFNGKITGERMGIGISTKRVAVYCRSGRGKLIDTEFANPRLEFLDVAIDDEEAIMFTVDYDRAGVEKVSGEVKIRARTPNARGIVSELNARLGR